MCLAENIIRPASCYYYVRLFRVLSGFQPLSRRCLNINWQPWSPTRADVNGLRGNIALLLKVVWATNWLVRRAGLRRPRKWRFACAKCSIKETAALIRSGRYLRVRSRVGLMNCMNAEGEGKTEMCFTVLGKLKSLCYIIRVIRLSVLYFCMFRFILF